MKQLDTKFKDVVLLELKIFGDPRGCFFEGFNKQRYADVGITAEFKQDNYSVSARGVLRGMHFQNPNAQGKLVGVLRGAVYDVVVDLRTSSPDFGKWFGVELNSENMRQMYVPPGFAHGFVSLADDTMFYYKCTELYSPQNEKSLLWNDPKVGIVWPLENPTVSAKDKVGLLLADLPREILFP